MGLLSEDDADKRLNELQDEYRRITDKQRRDLANQAGVRPPAGGGGGGLGCVVLAVAIAAAATVLAGLIAHGVIA